MAWYHTFFEGLPQIAWKAGQQENYTEWEVDFLADVLELEPASEVLDIMAGYGRHALPLAERGHQVTAVDMAADYCEEMERAARAQHVPVVVIEGDFLEVPLPGTFDAAYCLGNSFSFFPREVMRQFIQKVSAHLKPGGRFVAHTQLLAESVFPNFQEYTWMPVGDDIMYLARNEFDPAEGVIHAELTYLRGSEKTTRPIQQYVFTLADLRHELLEAGLELTEVFSSLDGERFALGDEHAYLLTIKKE